MTLEYEEIMEERNYEAYEAVDGNHYRRGGMEPIGYIVANDLDFIDGNIVKYVTRHKFKGGDKDVLKIIKYAVMSLRFNYGYTNEQIATFMRDEFVDAKQSS